MKIKRFISLALALVMVLGSLGLVSANTAVTTSAEADEYARLVDNGILIGDKGDLTLDRTLTRAEFAVIALRLKGEGFTDEETVAKNIKPDFTDVKETAWYAPYIGRAQAEGLVEGDKGKYLPDDNVKYVEALTMVMRALGYVDNVDMSNYPTGYYAKAKEIGLANDEIASDIRIFRKVIADTLETALDLKMNGSDVTLAEELGIEPIEVELEVKDVEVVDKNNLKVTLSDDSVHEVELEEALKANVETEVTFEIDEKEYSVKVTWVVDELEVEGVSAVNPKALKVTFNRAVEDTADAIFSVKRGNTVVATTVSWNEEATEATLTASVKLVAGDYTVMVSGVEIAEGKNVAETTVVPERIETIELANNAYRDSTTATTVTVDYKLFNQYGEDVTSNYATTNFTATSTKGAIASNQPSANGVITITGVAVETKILTVTLVDKTFGKTASKAIDVQEAKVLAKVTLGQPEIPEGKDKIERTATDVVIPYEAVDQFGEKVTLAVGDESKLTVVSSNTTALPTANVVVKSIGGKDKLAITAFGTFDGKKDITLTAIVNATGETSKVTFSVYGTATAKTPTLVAPAENPGVGDNPFNIELKMADNYGNDMKVADVTALTTSDVTIISSNPSIFTVVGSSVPQLAGEKAVVQINAVAEGTANLMITVNATGETSTIPVTVVAAKYPASMTLSLDKDLAAKGGQLVLKATFKDQYGNEMKTSSNIVRLTTDNADFTLDYRTPDDSNTVTALVTTGVTFTATDWEKTTKVKAELINDTSYDADKVMDTKNITLQSTKANVAEYTYSVEEIPTLWGDASSATTHKKDIKLVAKDASGKTVSLPSGYVTHITSTNSDIKTDASAMEVWATKKGTSTIALWKDATKLAEIEVTASDVAPAAESIKFKKEAITINGKDATDALVAIKAELEIKDQYGVAITPVGGTSGMWTSDKSTIAFTADNISTYADETDVTIGFITNNGKSATIKVTITGAL